MWLLLVPVHTLPLQELRQKAAQLLLSKAEDTHWNMPPWLGACFLSEYYFELKALNLLENSKFNASFFTQKLISQQLEDGSWKNVPEPNLKQGDFDCTLFNYWFLRETKGPEQTVSRALNFLRKKGGLQKAQVMSKFKLATFGQYPWHKLHQIPSFLFYNHSLYYYTYIKNYVAQWVYPHLVPLAYLRRMEVRFDTDQCLSQLADFPLPCKQPNVNQLRHQKRQEQMRRVVEEMKGVEGKLGSIGAYTISTLLSLLVLQDYTQRFQHDDIAQYYQQLKPRSFKYVQEMYFNSQAAYDGTLMDGRWWDTVLSLWALKEAGFSSQIKSHIQYVNQHALIKGKGIPYGLDFQYAPDLDDTSVYISAIGQMGQYKAIVQECIDFVVSLQNDDGGIPAFEKDKNDGQHLLFTFAFWFVQIDKSAQIFDPSAPDIVGHFLEAIGTAKLHQKYEKAVEMTVAYLKRSQNADGSWPSRWGVNFIYSFGAIIPGLSKIGQNLNSAYIRRATRFILERQNQDGGWGQSVLSYLDPQFAARGLSTPTQTAWALLGLLQLRGPTEVEKAIEQGILYLQREFESKGKWHDESTVGTGHRGVLYLQYPVYAYTFPLVAVSRFLKPFKSQFRLVGDEL